MMSASMYNMSICPDVRTAENHSKKYHRSPTLGFIGVTVGECFAVGGKVKFDDDPSVGELQYHASIYLNSDKKERAHQKFQLLRFAEKRDWITNI